MSTACELCGLIHFQPDIFHYADTVSESKFWADAFVLGFRQAQQEEARHPDLTTPEYVQEGSPRSVSLLVEDGGNNKTREQLRKNLMDSFALIFAQTGPEGAVATAMECNDNKPKVYTLHIARNYTAYCSLSDLAGHIKKWFNDKTLHMSQKSTKKPASMKSA